MNRKETRREHFEELDTNCGLVHGSAPQMFAK